MLYEYSDNGVGDLLRGLQSLGRIIAAIPDKKISAYDLKNIGLFISSITNLSEALNMLKFDCEHTLKPNDI